MFRLNQQLRPENAHNSLTTLRPIARAFSILLCFLSACAAAGSATAADAEISPDELAAVARSIAIESGIPCGRGGDQELRLDLARPRVSVDQPNVPAPCVVVIHGGAWRGGDRKQLHQLVQELAARGYVAASLEYRLCPQHVFPAQVEDVKCAVRYLRAHATEYQIDPQRIGAIGFSAGAHLSMLLGVLNETDGLHGTGGWADQSDQVQAVVAYFGPTQLDAPDLPDASKALVRDFLGGAPEQNQDQYTAASPATWVNSGDAPILLFQGTQDPLVPHTQAWLMTERLQAAGVTGRVEFMLGAGHGWGGKELQRTLAATFAFLNEHLNHTVPPLASIPGDHRNNAADTSAPTVQQSTASQPQVLFDGQTLDGWEGDRSVFRVEDGAIVGGQLREKIPHNFFLSTVHDYADFELTLEFKLVGKDTNAGVQIRSERIPDHHEMIGYQADLGQEYWGCLYDESRRRTVLARPDAEKLQAVLKKTDWNRYRILCKGRRIQLWINDFQTVDYTEQDQTITQSGKIALQIHSGPPGEAWYRNIRITEFKE